MEKTMIPKDPVMLLSDINTQLREFYKTLDAVCEIRDVDQKEVEKNLKTIDYTYDPSVNQFV